MHTPTFYLTLDGRMLRGPTHRHATDFYGQIVYHGGVSDGMFNTILWERNTQTRQVRINRPQFLHVIPARFRQGGNVSNSILPGSFTNPLARGFVAGYFSYQIKFFLTFVSCIVIGCKN